MHVILKLGPDGRDKDLELEGTDTIAEVRLKVAAVSGVHPEHQRLVLRKGDVELHDDTQTVAQHNIQKEDEIRLLPRPPPRVISLNVGGSHHATLLSTLRRVEGSRLDKMFDGLALIEHAAPAAEGVPHEVSTEFVPRQADGTYFIDRNGRLFEYVLDYLRDYDPVDAQAEPEQEPEPERAALAEISLPSLSEDLRQLAKDARFYGLGGLAAACQQRLALAPAEPDPVGTVPSQICTDVQSLDRLVSQEGQFNGRCFVLSYDVRFRSFDENYSYCIKSSTNAFQTHGLGPCYRGDQGKVNFYLHTTTGKGRHGRGELCNDNDGCLISKNKLDVDEWYRIDIHKEPTSQHLRVTNLSSGESAISDIASLQPGTLAEDFIMKDPGDITPDNGHSDRMVRNMKWKNINPDAARVWSLEGCPRDFCGWNWMSAQGEILFRLATRPKEGDVLVMNHNPDQWQHTWNAATTRSAERCNYAAAKLSDGRVAFTVMVDAEGYHVSTREGKKLHSFRHRLGWDSFSHVGYSDGLCCLEK